MQNSFLCSSPGARTVHAGVAAERHRNAVRCGPEVTDYRLRVRDQSTKTVKWDIVQAEGMPPKGVGYTVEGTVSTQQWYSAVRQGHVHAVGATYDVVGMFAEV